MKDYSVEFDPDSSLGSALRLVEGTGATSGLILDIGSGNCPLAELLRERGFDVVGLDHNPDAIADLVARGFEGHVVDLLVAEDELAALFERVVAGREVAVVMALDVLEHLIDPDAVLRAVNRLIASSGGTARLVVSIPNVTHFDMGAKLVAGRWDLTDIGLMDETHIRFFSGRELARLFARGGFEQEAADDVLRDVSDQRFPSDLPTLRTDSPLHELLRDVRAGADSNGNVFQYVRRLHRVEPRDMPPDAEFSETRPRLGAIVIERNGATTASLLADLEAQTTPLDHVVVVAPDGLAAAVADCPTRWMVLIDSRVRLAPDWSTEALRIADLRPGCVVSMPALRVDAAELALRAPAPPEVAALAGDRVRGGAFDLERGALIGGGASVQYVLPSELARMVPIPGAHDRADHVELGLWIAICSQYAGTVESGECLVITPATAMPDRADVGRSVAAHFDRRPIILPAGSAARLADLEGQLVRANRRAAEYERQIHRVDHDLAVERVELERLRAAHGRRPSVLAYRLARKVARRARRLLRGG